VSRRNGTLRFQTGGGKAKPQVPTGKKQRLNIERLANDGRGIGFVDGRTWFVSGALPGEEVEARVQGARAQVVEARAERILLASAERRPPPCVHAATCGGCSLQHMPQAAQLALKQHTLEEQLARVAGLAPEQWAAPLSGPELGYRRRARIAVRWENQQLALGFRAEGSQAIVAIDDCPVLVQPLQPILRALPALLGGFARPRSIGHVELFHGDFSVLLLRHTAALEQGDLLRLRDFCAQHQAQLWLQGDGEPQADQPGVLPGYRLAADDLRLAWQPGDFVQVNAQMNEAMVAQALDWLAPQSDERVLDLFCGLGNFALPLARRARAVVGVEGAAGMVERATRNAGENALNNLHFYQADLSKPLADAPWAADGFDAVLLDPPRDGAFEVVRQIARLGARRVLYVSCTPDTLARDAAELVRQGLRLKRAGILDMFPQTGHVEAMALFEADPDVRTVRGSA